MKRVQRLICMAFVGALALIGASCGRERAAVEWSAVSGRPPRIRPDYTNVVLPPNIAPLNFMIREPARKYAVRISGAEGPVVGIVSKGPKVAVPPRKWRRLLEANRGGEVRISVATKGEDGSWTPFGPITNRVADEPIDPYLSYRKIPPAFNLWGQIEIRQRDLESFGERPILQNKLLSNGCINCHSYRQNHTDRMTIGIRSADTVARSSLRPSRTCCRTVLTMPPARSGSLEQRRSAPSNCTAATVSRWPSVSCISRARRLRSSTIASSSTRAAYSWS